MENLFENSRILISVPPEGFRSSAPEKALFEFTEQLIESLHADAALAVQTVLQSCGSLGTTAVGMMRPEICADPVVLRWAEDRAGGFTEHLCLSTGRTLKIVAGRPNHLFIYNLSSQENHDAFLRLCRRAPELLFQYQTQVNTALRIQSSHRKELPSALMLPQSFLSKCEEPPIFEWWPTRGGARNKVPLVRGDPSYSPLKSNQSAINVIAVSSRAIKDDDFKEFVINKLHQALYDAEETLLQFPSEILDKSGEWIKDLEENLQRSGLKAPFLRNRPIFISDYKFIPWLLSKTSKDVYLALHHSEPLWRYNFGQTKQVKRILIFANANEINYEIYQEFTTAMLPVVPLVIWGPI